MKRIFDKIEHQQVLIEADALQLLEIENESPDYYRLLYYSRRQSREEYQNRGYIFAQIGINAEPCSVNCKFCSMASTHYVLGNRWRKSEGEVLAEANALAAKGASDVFLMTTADYPQSRFIDIGYKVRQTLPVNVRLVANIGDFDLPTARKLKEVGFTGIYHIVRLREGKDTGVSPQQREETLQAIQEAGLELYYCIEPIGPEHTYAELVAEMLRARQLEVEAMAVMRRTPVAGTPLFDQGQISMAEICKIAAVTRLVTRPSRSMNVHEVTGASLLAGVNQLYAEFGANPRDLKCKTEDSRGYSVERTAELLKDAGYTI